MTNHFQGTFTHVEPDEGGCLDVPFPVEHTANFNVALKDQLRDGIVDVSVHGINLSTYTNLDTGASLTGHAVFHNVDQSIVDNGDGTITVTCSRAARLTESLSGANTLGDHDECSIAAEYLCDGVRQSRTDRQADRDQFQAARPGEVGRRGLRQCERERHG